MIEPGRHTGVELGEAEALDSRRRQRCRESWGEEKEGSWSWGGKENPYRWGMGVSTGSWPEPDYGAARLRRDVTKRT